MARTTWGGGVVGGWVWSNILRGGKIKASTQTEVRVRVRVMSTPLRICKSCCRNTSHYVLWYLGMHMQ